MNFITCLSICKKISNDNFIKPKYITTLRKEFILYPKLQPNMDYANIYPTKYKYSIVDCVDDESQLVIAEIVYISNNIYSKTIKLSKLHELVKSNADNILIIRKTQHSYTNITKDDIIVKILSKYVDKINGY